MSDISYTLRTPADVGPAVVQLRQAAQVSMTDLARRTGKSRDTLYRLEAGEDVSVSTLMAVLQALGHGLTFTRAGLPTLEEMRQRFDTDDTHE
jgi:HTH-type transcriptional regulator / antitoxin HipB